jgi:hypothetical protein
MEPVSGGNRAYFAAVGALALWVGFWGFFVPDRVDTALPFLVPPLHARFLGAMYFSGLTLMIGGLFARTWAEVRLIPPITAVWTGGLLVVSLLNLEVFEAGGFRVAIWFAAYAIYPAIALWLMWVHRDRPRPANLGPPLPSWGRSYLIGQGVVATVLALALLVAPGEMADVWPWPINNLLAQIYCAPLLSYGAGSFLAARLGTVPEVRVAIRAMAVFAAGVLVASLLHLDLFAADEVPDVLWFTAFAAATTALGALAVRAVRTQPRGVPG